MTGPIGIGAARATLVVLRKEIADAVRDRRTWLTALASVLLFGPGSMLLMANLLSDIDQRVTRREVVLAGSAHAPTLVNFLQRSGAAIVEAQPDYPAKIASGELRNGVRG